MNVTELARRLKMTTKELLDLLPELGFAIGRRAIKVDSRLVDKIIAAVEAHRRQQRLQASEQNIREVKLSDAKGGMKELNKEISVPEVVTVKDFAELLNLPVVKIIAELMKNGVMVSLNERIDFETAVIIGEDLGYKVNKQTHSEQGVTQDEKRLKDLLEQSTDLHAKRPPVVVVMGHVDHGKTSLLDAIRSTNVVAGESGGITQHIGAYQVEEKGRLITFVDTPGHEAFKSMRSRGSKVADVAVVVVAADDGLKEQSLEVINLVQREKIPFIIAINKIDKEGADIERVKKELSELNIIPEDWGGKAICVPVSAKKKTGLNDLLDMILLVADMEDLRADEEALAKGTVIESHMSKSEGPVATVMVQHGTLRLNDMVSIGSVVGKVKVMKNFRGENLVLATPATPVKILGLKAVPVVGDILEVSDDKKAIKQLAKNAKSEQRATNFQTQVTEEKTTQAKQQLPVILKTDVLSSQEAILEHFQKYHDPEIALVVIRKGLGMIVASDIAEAKAANALILGFNVKVAPQAETQASEQNVEIKLFSVIYRLFEFIEDRLKNLLPQETIRTELGKIKVIAVFKTDKKGMIFGGKVLEGKIRAKTRAKVYRQEQVLTLGEVSELRVGKQVVNEAVAGEECGLLFKGEPIVQEGDLVEIYQEEIKSRELQTK